MRRRVALRASFAAVGSRGGNHVFAQPHLPRAVLSWRHTQVVFVKALRLGHEHTTTRNGLVLCYLLQSLQWLLFKSVFVSDGKQGKQSLVSGRVPWAFSLSAWPTRPTCPVKLTFVLL